tara:strand:- start:1453 stop:2466 length:1014 start_codon:yes stop_codon:yes gene_type:complete
MMSVFTRFDFENDVVENQRNKVSSGIFSGGSGTLTAFYTSSTQTATGSYYSVYHQNPASSPSTAEVQFDIGYAHYFGSGSAGNTTKLTTGGRETAGNYRQFANVLLAPNTEKFTFTGASAETNQFYFIVFNRARMREKIDPGNWEIKLGNFKFIDDSGATNSATVNEGGRVFNVVSGSLETGVGVIKTAAASEGTNGACGSFYPDLGVILLNPLKMNSIASLTAGSSSDAFDDNGKKLFQKLADGAKVQVRREEEISSTNYFCRVNNKKYNFSANPTFFTGSDGAFTQTTFYKDPKVYITQVGLYNDDNELLAIAKLSKPVLKSYSREAIIKVKLDF